MDNETKTLSAARLAHPTSAVIDVIDTNDGDIVREAIWVWDTLDDARNDDGSNAVAIYWLASE